LGLKHLGTSIEWLYMVIKDKLRFGCEPWSAWLKFIRWLGVLILCSLLDHYLVIESWIRFFKLKLKSKIIKIS
jgi:hypothetical protein